MSTLGATHPLDEPFSPVQPAGWGTATFPLGAHRDGDDVTLAVFSRRAERILLEIYDATAGSDARFDYWLAKNPADHVWRAKLARVPPGTAYGFRCWGPNWLFDAAWQRGGSAAGFVADVDAEGNRFNPNKVLFDPYARELSHDMHTPALFAAGLDGRLYATGGSPYEGRPRRELDTGRWAPKGLIIEAPGDSGVRPRLPREKAVIYEAHVRGISRHPSATELPELLAGYPGFAAVRAVPDELRGTYAGAAVLAPYLKALGFTAIELLPVQETDNDTNPDDAPGGNYWGYMTFGYFAPDRRYAFDTSPGGPTREFKAMVKAFHDEGLEVYLDVVYNHSGEGGNRVGRRDEVAFTSLGGFDAVEYYVLTEDGRLVDGATGTGNQINFSAEAPQRLVLDSLAYWIEEMGVDGFRFDLAVVLGRKPNNFPRDDWDAQKWFFPDHPLLLQIRNLGAAHDVEMIAEAWDLWGYQVGNFPAQWGEWNGRYRDAVRGFLKSDGNARSFISMVNGDYHHFFDHGGPQHSVNFVTAHDGFTLLDLVSYDIKNNDQGWPFGPSDGGTDDNKSWDSGGNQALRRQRLRNFWTIQAFSRGVPMAVWGDEFGRTQNGNNNPYNIDSVATWSNYRMLATNSPTRIPTGVEGAYHDNFGTADCASNRNPLFGFVRHVLDLRRKSKALKQRAYGDLVMDSGGDVTYWFKKEDGVSDVREGDRCISLRIDGSEVGEFDFLLFINMYWQAVAFTFPPAGAGHEWARIIDTATWAESHDNVWSIDAAARLSGRYSVNAYSIVVFREVA